MNENKARLGCLQMIIGLVVMGYAGCSILTSSGPDTSAEVTHFRWLMLLFVGGLILLGLGALLIRKALGE